MGKDGEKHRPVMLHRAIIGSFERFIGILIEHYAGRFPLWLAPLQIVVASITDETKPYVKKVCADLVKAGLTVKADLRNEKINFKIREHSITKVPIILVVGNKEEKENTVAMRRLGGKDQEILALDVAIAKLRKESIIPGN